MSSPLADALRPGMLSVQVDLVIGAVQTETDSSFSLTAIKAVNTELRKTRPMMNRECSQVCPQSIASTR